MHLLRFNGQLVTDDKAKLIDYGISSNAALEAQYERICPKVSQTSQTYVYEIMAGDGCDHLGLFSTLDKAKETLKEVQSGIHTDTQINRIPLDTISYFGEAFDRIE